MTPELCLGTAQFGLAYGITNKIGQVTQKTARSLLKTASHIGCTLIDTAQAYGEAETMLGAALDPKHNFRIISKLAPQKQTNLRKIDVATWDCSLQQSLKRLRQDSLDTLLLHSSNDLRKAGGEYLLDWLLATKSTGKAKRIGISIYDGSDLKGIPIELIDVVQLPLSIYDQRLINDGTVDRLRASGCSIHARSIYLQGLLLTTAKDWPKWTPIEARKHHSSLELLADKRKCSLLDLAIGFARAQKELEAVIIGFCKREEIMMMHHSWEKCSPWQNGEWRTWAMNCPNILDPRRWSAMS